MVPRSLAALMLLAVCGRVPPLVRKRTMAGLRMSWPGSVIHPGSASCWATMAAGWPSPWRNAAG